MKEKDNIKTVPRPLFKTLRKERGSQRFVSIELDIAESYLRHLENGYCDPSPKLMFKIADYFQCSVYDLFPDLADLKNWSNNA
ncbi:helix-turn-helix transcriptional regulator [Chengkuizengella marina]|uniref:helix-turn-helix transcriptional regulator n=1 Tax=Chengkuizengella marina TaxID=2507566 RepID=UPI0013710D1C|nr:helix-turn-helix transcriptional regulator [Chengkuizengella marina]